MALTNIRFNNPALLVFCSFCLKIFVSFMTKLIWRWSWWRGGINFKRMKKKKNNAKKCNKNNEVDVVCVYSLSIFHAILKQLMKSLVIHKRRVHLLIIAINISSVLFIPPWRNNCYYGHPTTLLKYRIIFCLRWLCSYKKPCIVCTYYSSKAQRKLLLQVSLFRLWKK